MHACFTFGVLVRPAHRSVLKLNKVVVVVVVHAGQALISVLRRSVMMRLQTGRLKPIILLAHRSTLHPLLRNETTQIGLVPVVQLILLDK